jgi:hypothetical protein
MCYCTVRVFVSTKRIEKEKNYMLTLGPEPM